MNEHKPLVSVIITTYNRSDILPRAIDSVLSQTYENIEIILVDDCSGDNTKEIIENNYKGKLKYLINEKNVGLAASRNVGINHSKGDFVSFLDDDDEILPTKIEKQVNMFLNDRDLGVAYCGSDRVYENYKLNIKPEHKGNILRHALRYPLNTIHSLLIRREILLTIGLFSEELHSYEDWDLWIRLAMCAKFDFVNEYLVIYHIHGNQMTFDLNKKIEHHTVIFQKYYDIISSYQGLTHWHYRKLLSRCMLSDRYDEAFNYILKSLKSNPSDPISYLHFVLFFISKKLQKKLILKFGTTKIGKMYIP